ncbi:MAG: hypothetical protein Q4B54_07915 [Coriobacteriales bacterium]|nr:hypothetical protein [Coriobacteriales bacterium]
MQIITANCPACGGVHDGRFTSRFITCEYCGTRFALSKQELDALGFVDKDGDGYDDHDTPASAAYEDDASSAPMFEFAREACEEFLDSGVDLDSFKESRKIRAGLGISDSIYLIHDDTMFKSGKNGFAITESGLYCREMSSSTTQFTSWDAFAKAGAPKLDGSYIRQGRKAICYYTDNSSELECEIMDLYRKLYAHARKVR